MNQDKFQGTGGGQSQADRILAELAAHAGEWVPMPRLARIGAGIEGGFCMVHSRVSDLNRKRRAAGLAAIENHSKHRLEDGTVVSVYRLPLDPQLSDSQLPPSVPPTSAPITAAQPRADASTSPSPSGPAATDHFGRLGTASPTHGELFAPEELRSAREAFA